MMMELINECLLDELSAIARENPRLRMNHNFHEGPNSKAQRLLNALEPGTVLPVHRHRHTAETYYLLRGRLRVVYFNDDGGESASEILDPQCGSYGVHIRAGQWHTVEVLSSGTVIFEVKDGPYTPLTPEDCL